jgi:AcrR family transcriptional regulator
MGTAERRQREKEKRRRDIVTAAENLFFAKGFEDTTIDAIAAEAEISKGTVYLYFDSKEQLHDAVVVRGMKILSDMFREAVEGAETGLEKTRAIGAAYMQFFREYEEYFDALLRYEFHEVEKFENEDPLVYVIDALRAGIDDGSVRRDIDPVKMAILLWGQTTGVLQNNHRKCRAIEQAFGVECEEIVNYYMAQVGRLLSADRHADGKEGDVD